MPIVISYNDVAALGALAQNSGYNQAAAQGQRQNLNLLADIDAQRNQTAAQLQNIQARERQSNADRALSQQQFDARQQIAYDQMAQQDAQLQAQLAAGLEEAGIREQGDITRQALIEASRQGRDERLHQQTLERIQREAELGKYNRSGSGGTSGGAALSAGGMPNDDQVEREIQQFGHLIPYGTANAISGRDAAGQQKKAITQASQITALPTNQLENLIAARPNDPWTPYARAVVEARKTTTPGSAPGSGQQTRGRGMPEGRSVPAPGNGGGYGGARGFGDSPLSDLSQAELDRLARDPALLNQLLSQ